MSKKITQFVVTLVLIGLPGVAFAQTDAQMAQVPGIRLAVFSPQRAFAESPEGKAGLARLNALRDQKAREIDERNKTLRSREEALERNSAVLSGDALSAQTKELEKFRLDVQRFIEDAQAEFLGVQKDIESTFLIRLKPVVDRVVKDKSLQLLFNLDEPSSAWYEPSIDITAEIVQQLAVR